MKGTVMERLLELLDQIEDEARRRGYPLRTGSRETIDRLRLTLTD